METLVSGTVPLSDFDADYADVDQALTRAGLTTPTDEDFRLAAAWWNDGRFADTPTLPHADHLHVFTSVSAAHAADQAGPADCTDWPEIPGQHAVTFAAVEQFDLGDTPATTAKARWAEALVTAGALAVSIRGLVEPARITRAELRRRRRQYLQDVTERYQAGKMSDGQQEETLADLEAIENAYAQGGPPTLVDATVLAALNGRFDDVAEVAGDSAVDAERDAVPAGGGVRRDLAVLTGPRRAAPARPALAHRRVLRAAVAVHRRRPRRRAARVHREGPATGVPVADRGVDQRRTADRSGASAQTGVGKVLANAVPCRPVRENSAARR